MYGLRSDSNIIVGNAQSVKGTEIILSLYIHHRTTVDTCLLQDSLSLGCATDDNT